MWRVQITQRSAGFRNRAACHVRALYCTLIRLILSTRWVRETCCACGFGPCVSDRFWACRHRWDHVACSHVQGLLPGAMHMHRLFLFCLAQCTGSSTFGACGIMSHAVMCRGFCLARCTGSGSFASAWRNAQAASLSSGAPAGGGSYVRVVAVTWRPSSMSVSGTVNRKLSVCGQCRFLVRG